MQKKIPYYQKATQNVHTYGPTNTMNQWSHIDNSKVNQEKIIKALMKK
jgi:hypothetical protein